MWRRWRGEVSPVSPPQGQEDFLKPAIAVKGEMLEDSEVSPLSETRTVSASLSSDQISEPPWHWLCCFNVA